MAFADGKDAKLLVDQTDLSAYIKGFDTATSRVMHDITTLGKSAHVYRPGKPDGRVTAEAFWDGEVEGIDEILTSAIQSSVSQVITGAYDTLAVGRLTLLCTSDVNDYGVQQPVDDMTQVSVGFQPSGGLEFGVSLWDAGTTVSATANGAGVNNGASSTNGLVAHLHILDISGVGATATVKIQHSTNGSTWVDKVTFTAAVAPGVQRVEVTGTINQHLRAVVTIAGTTVVVHLAVAVARR